MHAHRGTGDHFRLIRKGMFLSALAWPSNLAWISRHSVRSPWPRVHISELIAFQSWTRSHFIESTRFERSYHPSQRCYVSPCVSVRFPLFSFVDYVLRALLAPRVQLLLRHTPQLPLLSRW